MGCRRGVRRCRRAVWACVLAGGLGLVAGASVSQAAGQVTVRGRLVSVVADTTHGQRVVGFELVSGRGPGVWVSAGAGVTLRPGVVSLSAVRTRTGLVAERVGMVAGERSARTPAGVGGFGARVATATTTTGVLSTLVVLVDWTQPDSVTPTQAVQQVGVTDNAWYEQVSYGQSGLSATATPWLSIAAPSICNLQLIQSEGEAAAEQAGYDPSTYDRVMFYFPYTMLCQGESGVADIGGPVSWINGAMAIWEATSTTIHELGHNLGLDHSHALLCKDASGDWTAYSADCTQSEYGDTYDDMGGNMSGETNGQDNAGGFNAAQKTLLGWMNGREQLTRTSGTFTLAPLESQAIGLQGLAIPIGAETYWLEYRQPVGVDSWMYAYATDGVQVRLIPTLAQDYTGTDLLDMGATGALTPAALAVGQSWTDPTGKLTLTTLSADASGVHVQVTLHGDMTPPSTPTESVAYQIGSQVAPAPAGETGVYAPDVLTREATDASGVCGYLTDVYQNGSDSPTPTDINSRTTYADYLLPDETIGYSTVAVDCAENYGQFSAVDSITNRSVWELAASYQGGWKRVFNRDAWQYWQEYTRQPGASATYTFTGRNIGLITTRGPGMGEARIYLDGVYVQTIGLYRARTPLHRVVMFTHTWQTSGTHTIRIVNDGNPHDPGLAIDGFLTSP